MADDEYDEYDDHYVPDATIDDPVTHAVERAEIGRAHV